MMSHECEHRFYRLHVTHRDSLCHSNYETLSRFEAWISDPEARPRHGILAAGYRPSGLRADMDVVR